MARALQTKATIAPRCLDAIRKLLANLLWSPGMVVAEDVELADGGPFPSFQCSSNPSLAGAVTFSIEHNLPR
ncbi:uncharacterized protein N7529_005605 [Penicillium soppii]|uniref:uncharacterized protein n=1 Tax=Penicillium soppii TaxID=69789 RepID=UPI0025487A9D|nr:uncharacterized protein N7529_005605 [Penicillium soppii]KAJ5863689.1 hypothetical protein N7529_005605 [Penicillium soppii]